MLVDSEVAAVAAGCSVRTIQRAVRDGRLTAHGSGRVVRVELGEVFGDPLSLRGNFFRKSCCTSETCRVELFHKQNTAGKNISPQNKGTPK